MRLTQKKIEEILTVVVGEQGLPLVRELVGKENVSEFDLAKRTNFDIKIVRKLLYLMYNHNMICFTRKKDKQKGWYIYYWTLINESIRFSYFKMKRDLLEKLNAQLEQEEKELFFVCPRGCTRLNFDHATEFEFHCPECGDLLNQDDSKVKIENLKKVISETEKEFNKLIEMRRLKRIKIKEKRKEEKEKKKVVRKITKKPVKKAVTKEKATSKKITKKKTIVKNKISSVKSPKKIKGKKAPTEKSTKKKTSPSEKVVKKSVKKKSSKNKK